MDWIRNNKFMAGFLAFMLVGVGALGYLLYSSYDTYTQVAQEYQTQVAELDRLHAIKPYPDDKGLKKYSELRQSYTEAVNRLQAKLAAYEPPPENPPLNPIQFADKLRQTVESVSTAAQNAGTGLPENFYLGFEQYRGSPPDAPAAPALSRELDEISSLMGLLIKLRVDKITLVKRAPLPLEPGSDASTAAAAAAAAAAAGAPGNARVGKPAPGTSELVTRNPVEISFQAQPSAFREALNQITSASRLYVIRSLQVTNQEVKGPLREDNTPVQGGLRATAESTAAPGGVDANGVPIPPLPDKNAPPPLRYVVGLEKVIADMRIELVRVDSPAVAPAAR